MKGVVTDIDDLACSFRLDNGKTIYVWDRISRRLWRKYPKIGSTLEIKNYIEIGKGELLYLTEYSKIVCNEWVEYKEENKIAQIIHVNRIRSVLVKSFDDSLKYVRKYFSVNTKATVEDIFSSVLEYIVNKTDRHEEFCPFQITSVSNLRYVPVEAVERSNEPELVYSMHKNKDGVLCVGWFKKMKAIHRLIVQDGKNFMRCIITNRTSLNVEAYLDNYVLISSYYVFAESFNEEKVLNLEYLVFDLQDVHVLKNCSCPVGNAQPLIRNVSDCYPCPTRCRLPFKVSNKTPLKIDELGNVYFDLDVIIFESEKENERLTLSLHGKHYNELIHIFEMEKCYNMYFNGDELLPISTNYFKISKEGVFFAGSGSLTTDPFDPSMVEEPWCELQRGVKLISFRGLVKERRLIKISDNSSDKAHYGFGTPGNYEHCIVFYTGKEGYTVDLYLEDFKNTQTIFGLIPKMDIIVRNAENDNNECLKTGHKTSFEIVKYDGEVINCAKRIYATDWGPAEKLSNDTRVPKEFVVWFTLLTIEIECLKLHISCTNCFHQKLDLDMCKDCGCDSVNVEFYMLALSTDGFRTARFIFRDLDIFKYLIKFSPCEMELFKEKVKACCHFEYNNPISLSLEGENKREQPQQEENSIISEHSACRNSEISFDFDSEFCYALKDAIDTINVLGILEPPLRVMCLKEKQEPYSLSSWNCVDFAGYIREF